MHFRGGGVGHRATQNETRHLAQDVDSPALDDTEDSLMGDNTAAQGQLEQIDDDLPHADAHMVVEGDDEEQPDDEAIPDEEEDYGYEGEGSEEEDDPLDDAGGVDRDENDLPVDDELGAEDGEDEITLDEDN